MAYETYWEEEGIRREFSGTVTDDDLLRCNRELYDDPRFVSIRYELVDFLAVDGLAAGADVVRRVARMDKEQSARNPDVRVAIVAKAPLVRGLSQLYALSAGETPWVTELFETEEGARAWLGA
ncbi:MAG: hypothetical protein ABIG03_01500 [Candidatus Eisenbacteria bacterium]